MGRQRPSMEDGTRMASRLSTCRRQRDRGGSERIERSLGQEAARGIVPPGSDLWFRVAPQDVLRDPTLSQFEKRDVLRRWALEAYQTELALSKGDPVPHPSRLIELIDALIDLDQPELQHILDRASKLNAKGGLAA
jgi:hypothetical protein